MSEGFKIWAIAKNGSAELLSIYPSTGSPWNLVANGCGMENQKFEGSSLFDALILLREQLEGTGLRLLCAGARRDTCPSGMARSMGGARKAYVCELGKPATELVDIFAGARLEQVGTLREQQLYRQKWIASLKEKM